MYLRQLQRLPETKWPSHKDEGQKVTNEKR